MSALAAPNGYPDGGGPYLAVWTGAAMLLWANPYPGNSGAYDPATDTWRAVSTAGAPGPFYDDYAIWTGSEVIVWGNDDLTLGTPAPNGVFRHQYVPHGGAYDPAADTWRPLSESGAPSSAGMSVVWTGSEVLAWTGQSASGGPAGAAYDPASDHWKAITAENAPLLREGSAAVWTGSVMLAWGESQGAPVDGPGDAAAYDPVSDTWTTINTRGAPAVGGSTTVLWAGGQIFAYWGPGDNGNRAAAPEPGVLYQPFQEDWQPISLAGAPVITPIYTPLPAVWTGWDVLLWDGSQVDQYDPGADTWSTGSAAGEPSPRDMDVPLVWTGSQALIWGGGLNAPGAEAYRGDGAVYTPCASPAGTAPGIGAAAPLGDSLLPSR